jgi:hypothetical protein
MDSSVFNPEAEQAKRDSIIRKIYIGRVTEHLNLCKGVQLIDACQLLIRSGLFNKDKPNGSQEEAKHN